MVTAARRIRRGTGLDRRLTSAWRVAMEERRLSLTGKAPLKRQRDAARSRRCDADIGR